MIDEKNEILDGFTEMIKNNQNFSFTKFGDGEFLCMHRWFGKNCDGDSYHRKLGSELKDAFTYLAARKDVYLGKWHVGKTIKYLEELAAKKKITNINWVHYHTIMNASPIAGITDFNSLLNDKMFNFVKAIKISNRKKILFTNKDNEKLKKIFNADVFIETKKNNWSYEFDDYFKIVEKECVENAIFIIAAGLSSKVMIAKILQKYNMTCLDIGSGFDLLATAKHTRPWSHTYEDEVKYYKELLPSDW